MKIKWLGHSCFQLTLNNGKVLATDPYDESVGYPPLRVACDAALSSHAHHDHNCFDALEGNPVILNEPGERELFGARITAVPCFHDEVRGAKRGKNLIHVIEADGLRIAHLGDLGHLPDTDAQRAALTGLDVLLIPIGGYYTIDTPAAVRIIRKFEPRCAIAMHFANRYCHYPVSDESEFVRLAPPLLIPEAIPAAGGASTRRACR